MIRHVVFWIILVRFAGLIALPQGMEVTSGTATTAMDDASTLSITADDKTILNFESFGIAEHERVNFIQPNSQASVLGRVKGRDRSEIFGRLDANGRLFLINPNGILFGPNSQVNVGSLIASTLNIKDEDFLNEKYNFFIEEGSKASSIINEGRISAEGFAALIAPFTSNKGSILAAAGKVMIGAAEKVSLDFSGDGLIRFMVDGEIEKALIENAGAIQAARGAVELKVAAAKRVVQSVVNTDGIEVANAVEVVEGEIHLYNSSVIQGKSVGLDTPGTVTASGQIIGDTVEVFGHEVHLRGVEIDASSPYSGGTVLIGGDYQGKGSQRNARFTTMDELSVIRADALENGNGGKVIVWADETAIFDGKIYARGGKEGGDGGFVETSGAINLGVTTGNVYSISPKGKVGSWLMDPNNITIVRNNGNQGPAGLTTAATCTGGNFNLNDTTINNAASTVILCTAGNITYNNGAIVNITTAGVGIQHGAASTPANTTFQTGAVNTWSIITNNGPLTFNGPVTIPSTDTMSLTTSGGSVNFASTINGAGPLVISAGAGTTTFTGAVGATTALTSMNVTSATITQTSSVKTTGAISYTGSTAINVNGNMTTAGGTVGFTGPVNIANAPTIDTTNAGGTAAGATVTFGDGLNGATALTLRAGTAGNVIFTGAVGGVTPLTNIVFTSAAQARVGNNITVSGANTLNFSVPVLLTGTSTITSNNANLTFASTLNGAQNLTIAGGSGTTTFTGAVGGSAALTSLSTTSATIVQSSTAKTVNNLVYTGSSAINIAGNVTTSGGLATFTGPTLISGAPTFDTTNSGGTPAGANITFSGTLNGATTATFLAGTAGNVIFNGVVGGSAPPTNLTFSSAAQIQIGNSLTVSGANPLSFSKPVLMTGTSTITSNNAAIGFTTTLNGAQNLTIAGGSGITTFSGIIGGTTPLSSLSVTSATINQNAAASTTGTLSYTGSSAINVTSNITTSSGLIAFTGPLSITGAPTFDTTNGGGFPTGANITFSGTVNGATALTLRAGTAGNIVHSGIVGGSSPLTSYTITSANNLTLVGFNAALFNQLAGAGTTIFNGPVVLSGASGFSFVGSNLTFNNTLSTASGGAASVNLSGTLVLTASAALSLDGAFSQIGAGSTQSAGSITTTNDQISFAGGFSSTGSAVLNTGSTGANILFSSTVDGPGSLNLTALAGNITFTGSAGALSRLGALTINSCTNFTSIDIAATSILLSSSTGTATFNGTLNTSGASGIQIIGNTINRNGDIITTNGGSYTVTNSGTLTGVGGGLTSISGSYIQNGSGAVNFQGTLISVNGNISFARNVNLTGALSLNSSAGGGTITLSNGADGGQTLSLSSGTGTITSAAIGSGTRLTSLSVLSAGNASFQAIKAGSISQSSGTGTTTFNGAIDTNGVAGVNLAGSGFTIAAGLTTTGGPVVITNSGTFTLSSTASVGGAFTQDGTGTNALSSSLTASGAVNFASAITLSGSPSISTAAANQNITLSSTVNGSGNLTLAAGSGNILIAGVVGGTARIGNLVFTSANNITTSSITAATITQSAGSGTSTFGAILNTNAVGGIQLTGTNFLYAGALTTINAGPVVITNSGTLTANTGSTATVDGSYTQNGTGPVVYAGSITTNNQPISFASAITLQGTTSFSTGSGAGDITLSGIVNGGFDLSLTAGTGDILLSSTIGGITPINTLTIASARNVSAGIINAGNIIQTAGTGTSTFSGALSTTTASGISLTGTNFSFVGGVTTTSAGPFAVTESGSLNIGSVFSIDGAFTQSGSGTVSLGNNITTNAQNISFAAPITLTGATILSTGAGSGNISLSAATTVNGAFDFTLTAGNGDVSVAATVGGSTPLNTLTISGNNISLANLGPPLTNGVTGATIITGLTSFTFAGTSYQLNNFTLTAPAINFSAGAPTTITTSGDAINFTATDMFLSATTSVTINTVGGDITLPPVDATTGSLRSLTLNAGTGQIQLSTVGTLSSGEFSSLVLTAGDIRFLGNVVTSSLSISQTGTSYLGAGITTTTGGISFPTSVIRNNSANATLTSASNITFSGALNGDADNTRNLNLSATSGTITFAGVVGAVHPLNTLNILSAQNVTATTMSVASLIQTAGTGTTTFNGALNTTASGGVNLTGAAFAFNNTITTTSSGALTLSNSGAATFGASATLSLSGGLTQSGSGTVSLANAITAGAGVSFGSVATLAGNTSINTSAANSAISFAATVNGSNNLTLAAGTGDITFSDKIGFTTRIGALTVSSANNINATEIYASSANATYTSGTFTVTSRFDTNGPLGVTVVGPNLTVSGTVRVLGGGSILLNNVGTVTGLLPGGFVVDNNFTQLATGTSLIAGSFTCNTGSFTTNKNFVLAGPFTVDTSGGNGTIHMVGTIDGATTATFNSGSGPLLLDSAIGSNTALSALNITNAGNVTVASTVRAQAITQSSGSGTTDFTSLVTTTGSAGLAFTGSAITFQNGLTTLNSGPVTITNSGLLTISSAGPLSLDGAFNQNGSGTSSVAGSITTTGDNISFATAVALAGNFALDTGTSAGSINFGSAITGAHNLTLNSRGGGITLTGDVGTIGTPINVFTVTRTGNLSAASIYATSVTMSASSGTATWGLISTSGASGINLVGTNLVFNGTLTTTTGGPLALNHTGIATFNAAATANIAGSVTQVGGGTVVLAGSITSGGLVDFAGGVTCQGASAAINSSGNNIVFQSTVDGVSGVGDLNLTAGAGDITFTGNIGSNSRLGALIFTSANNITTASITAVSILQSAGTGTTTFSGSINTNGASGINKTGNNFIRSGNLVTTGGGGVTVNNSGTLQCIGGSSASVSGNYNQAGAGPVQYSGSLTTTNGSITFTGPITLFGAVNLNSSAGGQNIIVHNTIDGGFDLTLASGTGNTTLESPLGGANRLGNVTFTSATDLTFVDITASTIAITSATGTTTLNGNLNTSGAGGIDVNVNRWDRNGNITTTNGGPYIVNNSGNATVSGGSTTSIDGGYYQTGSGTVFLGGTIGTNNAIISYAGPISLTDNAVLNAGSAPVTIGNTVDGAKNLSITAGTGTLTLSANIGNTIPLGVFTINSAGTVNASGVIKASSISAPSIAGLATFNGAITTSGALGIALTVSSATFNAGVTTTGTGPMSVSLSSSAPLTIASGVSFNLDGAFGVSGTGTLSLGGSVTTTNDAISVAVPVNLIGAAALNTGAGAGNISITRIINGAQDLVLTAGTGTVTVSANIGQVSPLTKFQVVSGSTLTIQNTLVNGPFTTSVTGLTTLNGPISTTTASGISITTGTLAANSTLTTTGLGPISLVNSGAASLTGAISSSSTFTQSGGGAITLSADVTTSGALQFGSAIGLGSRVTLTSNGSNITLSTVDNTFDLDLVAGAGDISVGNIGSSVALSDLNILSARNVTAGLVNAATITQSAGTGLTHFTGALTTSDVGGIALTGSAVTLDANVTTSALGPVSIVHTGALTIGSGSTMSLAASFSESGGGAVSMGGAITTASANISWADSVTLSNNVTLSSGVGAGNITFSGTVNGGFNLGLTAGSGIVQFSQTVGGITPLNTLSATGGTYIQNASMTTTSTIDVTAAMQIGGNMTTTNSGITLTGNVTRTNTNNVTLNSGSGAGNISITGTINGNQIGRNLTLSAGTGTVTVGGAIGATIALTNLTASGSALTLANIGAGAPGVTGTLGLSSTGAINFSGTVYNAGVQNYTAATSFNYTANSPISVTSQGSSITYTTGTIDVSPAANFSLSSNGGTVVMTDFLDSGVNLVAAAGNAPLTIGDVGTVLNPLNDVTLSGSSVTHGTINATGTVTITTTTPTLINADVSTGGAALVYNSPIIITNTPITFSTDDGFGGGNSITFNSTLNSDSVLNTRNVSFVTNGNPVVFNATVGGTEALTSITITDPSDVTIGTMNVGSITQTQTSFGGTTTIAGNLSTTAIGGVSIKTNTVDITGAIATTGSGPVLLDVATSLLMNGISIESDGPFTQQGAGTVSIGGSVLTSNDAINFAGTTTLTGALTLTSTGGDITHTGTIDGGYDLALDAGSGSLAFSGAIGNTTRIGALSIVSANNAGFALIKAASIDQLAGTGTTTFNSTLNTNTLAGINLTGNAFVFDNTITTTASGPVLINNSGSLTLNAGASVSGAFAQSGSGTNSIGGTITAGGVISFATATTLNAASVLDTSSSGSSISFGSTIDGAFNLEMNAGASGLITVVGAIGDNTRVGDLLIDNVDELTFASVKAASLTQTAGTDLSIFGAIDTSTLTGVSLTGNQFSITGNLITSALGPFTITNTGVLSLNPGASTSITGIFTQSGGGAVSLSGTLTTVNTAINLASAITLTGNSSLSTGAGAGNMTFGSTIDGGFNLSLLAGAGNISFGGSLGAINRLNAFTVTSVTDITYPSVRAVSINQVASSGTTVMGGTTNSNGTSGISITGTIINQTGAWTTLGTGPFSITHTGAYTLTSTISSDGAFTESGGGSVSLNGSITTTSDALTLNGNVTLAGSTVLSTGGGGGGNITLNGTVNGAQNLTLTGGTGAITFASAVGGGTRLGAIQINSAGDVTTGAVTASTISQLSGSGTTTFNGNINTNNVAGITLIGSGFTINSGLTTTASGPLFVSHSGTLTLGASANLSISAGLSESGGGAVVLSGTTTVGGNISLTGATSISVAATLDTSANNTTINFSNTVNGSGDLTLTLGTGTLNFQSSVGATTALGNLLINSAGTLTAQSVRASSITQTLGGTSSQFNGSLTATGLSGISITSPVITFGSNITSAGPTSFVHTGLLTLPIDSTVTSTGAFSESGGGTLSLGSNITSTNAAITFSSPITLAGAVSINSGSGAGDVTFHETVDGAFNLTVSSGTGDVFANEALIGGGTRLAAVQFGTVHDLNIYSLSANSITLVNGTGSFNVVNVDTITPGTLNTNGAAGMNYTGHDFYRRGSLVTTNGGSVVVTNSGTLTGTPINTTSIDGSYTINGNINFAGTATVNNGGIFFNGTTVLVGNAILDASTGSGGVAIAGTVNGAFDLTLLAGSADASVTGAIGASTPITSLTITGDDISINNIGAIAAGVTGATALTGTGSLTFTGTTYNAGLQTYNTPVFFNFTAGSPTTILSNGSNLIFQNGTILQSSTTNLTLNSGGGALTLGNVRSAASAGRSFSAASGAGNLQVGQIGSSGNGEFASVALSGTDITFSSDIVSSAVSFTSTGTLYVGGNVTTTNTALTLPATVILNTSPIFSTGSSGANITFAGTLDGDVSQTRSIFLTAAGGSITFSGLVGNTGILQLVQVNSAASVTVSAAMKTDFLRQIAGTGTTTLNAPLTISSANGVLLTGTGFAFNNLIDTSSAPTPASVSVNNSGTLSFSGTATLSGRFTQSGSGGVNYSGSITAAQPVSFAGPVVISGTPVIDTSAASQNISFTNTLNGAGDLTLAAGGGNVSLTQAAGGITPLGDTVVTANNISINNLSLASLNATATGLMNLAGDLTGGSGGITLVGVNFTRSGAIVTTGGGSFTVTNSGTISGTSINTTSIDGSYTQNGTGPVFFAGTITAKTGISFSSPITLLAGGALNTSGGVGNISLAETVDGGFSFALTAGSGNITLSSPLGSITPLGAFSIASAADVSAVAITATSITQTAGSGTSTFSGALLTTGVSGINLAGTHIIRGAGWTAAGTGGITIANSGTFTSTSSGLIASGGAFAQTGSGSVIIEGTVQTTNQNLSFAGPVTLNGALALTTGAGSGAITFSGVVNGAQNLSLLSGSGNIVATAAIGGTTRLGAVLISQASSATFTSLKAASFNQSSGSGTTTFSGTLDTNTLAGISITTSGVTLSGGVNTTTSGPLVVNNTGTFTLTGPASIAAGLTQVGSGPSVIGNSVVAAGTISFSGAVSVTGSASMNSTSNPIIFSTTLNGPGNLTLNPGTSTFTIGAPAGATSRLGSLTILAASDVSTHGLRTTSFTQVAGTGTTTITGDINTAGAVSLSGTNFTIAGNLISTASGAFTVSHTGLLNLTAGASSLLTGAFTESGVGGTVNLSGIVHASNSNISFANPITLVEDTVLNSDGGGDITISSTLDGPYDLSLDAGTGNILISANLGSTTPLTSMVIVSANNVSTQDIHTGSLSQTSGTGTSTFNGAITTTLPAGIVLSGAAFDFEGAVSTSNAGPVSINNTGNLTLSAASSFNSNGAFTQSGSGTTLLATTVTTSGPSIAFGGPISLTGDSALSTDDVFGNITLSGTLNGASSLTLTSGSGAITFGNTVGAITPLSMLHITKCASIITGTLNVGVLTLDNCLGTGSFGIISTTGAISLTGNSFNLNNNISTSAGALTIDKFGILALGNAVTLDIHGIITVTGTGSNHFQGTLLSNGNAIDISGPTDLLSNLSMTSSGGHIIIRDDIEGAHSLTLSSGAGDITLERTIAQVTPLVNLTVTSAHDVHLSGIGAPGNLMSGTVSVTSSDLIEMDEIFYGAHQMVFTTAGDIDLIQGALMTYVTDGGQINFGSSPIHLNGSTDLLIQTNNGNFSFNDLKGTGVENATIQTGTGTLTVGTITAINPLNTLTLTGGSILFAGALNLTDFSATALGSIQNEASMVAINTIGDAFFNSLTNNVGMILNPILVNAGGQIIVGGTDLAAFDGTSIDNTVNVYLPNPPCVIYFNGVKIKDCGHPTPPPPPPAPPSPGGGGISGERAFVGAGMESSFFNLADYYYFTLFFVDKRYFKKEPEKELYYTELPFEEVVGI